MATNQFGRITYSAPATTSQEQTARNFFEAEFNEMMERFHNVSRSTIAEIEMYPCPADCADCIADAA